MNLGFHEHLQMIYEESSKYFIFVFGFVKFSYANKISKHSPNRKIWTSHNYFGKNKVFIVNENFYLFIICDRLLKDCCHATSINRRLMTVNEIFHWDEKKMIFWSGSVWSLTIWQIFVVVARTSLLKKIYYWQKFLIFWEKKVRQHHIVFPAKKLSFVISK